MRIDIKRGRTFIYALMKYVLGMIVLAITYLHYTTPTTVHYLHELYKVLYFIPIILASFLYGFKGGLMTSLIISIVYLPHILLQWGGALLMNISRLSMILIYIVVGGLTGYLWQRERAERKLYQRTSEKLADSFYSLEQKSEELASIESQLRTAERLSTLGELTASLAHEVRNPLGSIQGAAEILRDEYQNDSNKKFIDILLQETRRLESVVANYLSFAKSQSSKWEQIDLVKLIPSMTDILGPEARKRNITFTMRSERSSIEIKGNEGLIRQAVLNVLINAVQASPEGGKIDISMVSDKRIRIEIFNEGKGIPQDVKSRIFEPFYTTKTEGTGLGLAITKRIVKEHGGAISLKSKSGYGTTIIMEFPHGNTQ